MVGEGHLQLTPSAKQKAKQEREMFLSGPILFCCLFLLFHAYATSGWCGGIVGVTEIGTLSVRYLDMRGNAIGVMSSTNAFRASISLDGRWLLEVRPIPGKRDKLYGKQDVMYSSYDGVDTFYCRYTEAVFAITNGRPQVVNTLPVKDVLSRAYISRGNYPFAPQDEQRRTHVLWLVFGAGISLRTSPTNTMPIPWLAARWNLQAYGFRPEADLSPDAPYIPIAIKFVRDAALDLGSLDAEEERPDLDRKSSPYSRDDLRAQLERRKNEWPNRALAGLVRVHTRTNFSGMSLPLSFTVESYYPNGSLNRAYCGTVASVMASPASEDFRPPVEGDLSVHDSRFRLHDEKSRLDSIVYTWKGGEGTSWPATNAPRLIELQRYFLTSDLASPRRSPLLATPVLRRLWIGMFMICSLAGVFVLLRRRTACGKTRVAR